MSQSASYRREFIREPAPRQLCNIPRLIETMQERDVDGVVALLGPNQYYLSSYSTHHQIPDTDGLLPVVFSRHDPEHPILMVPDFDIARLAFQPTWIEDIRVVATALLHVGHPATVDKMSSFMTSDAFEQASWTKPGAAGFHDSYTDAITTAMRDLGLDKGRIAFDNYSTGCALATLLPKIEAVPGDGLIRFVRASKTPAEMTLMRQAAAINQQALDRTVAQWQPGMTWHDVTLVYQIESLKLGGLPNLPDTMGIGNSYVTGEAIHSDLGCVDTEINAGDNIVFDCHGKFHGYCWDGGKSWAVGGEPSVGTRRHWEATVAAAQEIAAMASPGVAISKLVDRGLDTYRKFGVSDEGVLIFFHGLGLDHIDQDVQVDGKDWLVQDDMVISTHIYFPGDSRNRLFLEDIVLVNRSDNERLFTWGDEMLGC